MDNVLLSGGCVGADTVFGIEAVYSGHGANHYSFSGHKLAGLKPVTENAVRLNDFHLSSADKWLKLAAKALNKPFPTKSVYVSNLLRRNYFQVKTTERVYAITTLSPVNGTPNGGTGWAVMMAVFLNVPEIYVFDHNQKSWFKFIKYDNTINVLTWDKMDGKPPRPHGRYTGIGSHDLTESGRMAIIDLYRKNSNG